MISKMNSIDVPNGILVVDKPAGWTSHDVVNKTRRLLGGVKVGHTGTLDPMATGVLILLVGKATKAANRFENDTKRYSAEVTFGSSTDTYDGTGETIEVGNPDRVDREYLARVVRTVEGESEQLPPMYSAVKVGGKKLYELARAGKTVERKPRAIVIHSITLDMSKFPLVHLDLVCSKGTYVRSIAHQLGVMTGCPAHLSGLRRTAAGNYGIERAVDFSALVTRPDATETLVRSILPIPEPMKA